MIHDDANFPSKQHRPSLLLVALVMKSYCDIPPPNMVVSESLQGLGCTGRRVGGLPWEELGGRGGSGFVFSGVKWQSRGLVVGPYLREVWLHRRQQARHINQQAMCGRAVWELPDSAIRSQTRTNSLAVAAAPQNRHVWLSSGWEPPAWQEALGGLNQNFISILLGWIMTFDLFLFYSDLGPVFQYFSAFDPRNSVICEQTHHLSTNSSRSGRASLCSVTFPMESTFFPSSYFTCSLTLDCYVAVF